MIEEIKTDNNCIVKAFENNPISILGEDIGNKRVYYFKASDIGKVLDIVNIRTSIVNFDEDEKVVRTTYSSNSGNQDSIFLTSRGVYRLLYSSKKEVAKKFRKWASDILDDIIFNQSRELQRQLQEKEQQLIKQEQELQQKDQELEQKDQELIYKLDEKDQEFERNKRIDKHNLLLQKFSSKRCIYLSEIDDNENNNIKIKIGSTNDIKVKRNNLKDVFGSCLFLDIFECEYHREVEQHILVAVRDHLYKRPINGHTSKEVVELKQNFNYAQLTRIVTDEIKRYNEYMFWKMRSREIPSNLQNSDQILHLLNENNKMLTLLFDKIQQPIQTNQTEIQTNIQTNQTEIQTNIQTNQTEIQQPIQQDHQNQNTLPYIDNVVKDVKIITSGSRGRKIQEIDPDNLNVIRSVYTSMIYLLRQKPGYEKHCIQNAIRKNTVYKGSRWLFVEQDQDPNIVNKISPTAESSQPEQNIILKLNLDKTVILESLSGIGQMRRKYKIGDNKIISILRNKSIFDNAYFMKITDCPQHLLENYTLPSKCNKKAQSIKSTNVITGEEIVYKSINEMYVKTGITYKRIAQIIKNSETVNQCEWKYIS